ncbi:MAG TPA: restriction endonuclease subunit S, partial [Bacillota bacterium]|nr:restriction endonuclease subunit S [Bacillota bacterium]
QNREVYLLSRVGARQRNLNKGFISELKIPFPPLSVQQEIVNRINEEQTIINQNKRLIEIFEGKIKDKIAEVWGE